MTEDSGSARGAHGGRRKYAGPERREAQTPDRRQIRRGGRRATDTLSKVAKFVFQLLTEPPR